MQAADQASFDGMLAELFAALDKPLTEVKRSAFWKGLHNMSLTEFARCRDYLLRGLEDGEARKSFAVSDVWAAKRALRARAPEVPELPASTEPPDYWMESANLRLLRHFRAHWKKLAKYGEGPSYESMRKEEKAPVDHRGPDYGDASWQYITNIRSVVDAKNTWVREMKDLDRGDGVPPEIQKQIWDDYVGAAERKIMGAAT